MRKKFHLTIVFVSNITLFHTDTLLEFDTILSYLEYSLLLRRKYFTYSCLCNNGKYLLLLQILRDIRHGLMNMGRDGVRGPFGGKFI